MGRTFTSLTDPAYNKLFETIERSWFRLETLQEYEVDYESAEYTEFLRTGRFERADESWQRMIRTHAKVGRTMQRVHVVVQPVTDYLRYELAAYQLNAAAGEDIRLLPVADDEWPAALPQGEDFWLFDDQAAWRMDYDQAGRFLAAVEVTDPAVISEYRHRRNLALSTAVPLADFLSHAG